MPRESRKPIALWIPIALLILCTAVLVGWGVHAKTKLAVTEEASLSEYANQGNAKTGITEKEMGDRNAEKAKQQECSIHADSHTCAHGPHGFPIEGGKALRSSTEEENAEKAFEQGKRQPFELTLNHQMHLPVPAGELFSPSKDNRILSTTENRFTSCKATNFLTGALKHPSPDFLAKLLASKPSEAVAIDADTAFCLDPLKNQIAPQVRKKLKARRLIVYPDDIDYLTTNGEVIPQVVFIKIKDVKIGSGTLITKRHVLTAAHVVSVKATGALYEPKDIKNLELGPATAGTPYGKSLDRTGDVTQIVRNPGYIHSSTGQGGQENNLDVAIIELSQPVTDFLPCPFNRSVPSDGVQLTIAGFGWGGNGSTGEESFSGEIFRRGIANSEAPTPTYIWWDFDSGTGESQVAQGDSGGPAFIGTDQNGTFVIGGVIHAGDSPFDYNTNGYAVRVDRSDVATWIDQQTATLDVSSGSLVSSGPVGGGFSPASTNFTLTNPGTGPLSWTSSVTYSGGTGWVTVSPASGTIPAGSNVSVSASINSGANALPVAGYTATIGLTNTTTNNNRGSTTRTVTLSVGGAAPPPEATFLASADNHVVSLSWANRPAAATGTLILRRTDSYPVSALDLNAVRVYEGSGTSHTDTGLSNGTVYYYSAFHYNSSQFFNPLFASAMPEDTTPRTISGNAGISGATITFNRPGPDPSPVTSDGSGNFSQTMQSGSIYVTPSKTGYVFSPPYRLVNLDGANVSNVNFTASLRTYAASGNISIGEADVTLTFSGSGAPGTATSDAQGNWYKLGFPNGTFTVTPSKAGTTFTPASRSITVSNGDAFNVNFSASTSTFTVSGNTGIDGATVQFEAFSGYGAPASVTSDGSGNWSKSGFVNGTYQVTPSRSGYYFTPSNKTVTVSNGNVSAVNFTATAGSLPVSVAFGTPQFLNSSALTDTGSDAGPDIATSTNGTWIAVWQTNDTLGGAVGTDLDIVFSRSTDNGKTWSQIAVLNTNAATDSGDDFVPRIATDGSGNWVVAWSSKENLGGTIGVDRDILVSRSTDNGLTWSAPVVVNSYAASDTGDDNSPSIVTNGSGAWVVAWHSVENYSGKGTDSDVVFARSTDNGLSWSTAGLLNSNAIGDAGSDSNVQLAMGNGVWIAVWRSRGGPSTGDTDIYFSRSTDSGQSWSGMAALNTNAGSDGSSEDDAEPHIATDGSGNWIAVWQCNGTLGGTKLSEDDILAARSSDGGASWSTPVLTNASTANRTNQSPFIATDRAGNWRVLWHTRQTNTPYPAWGSDDDILESHSSDNGQTWSATAVAVSNALAGGAWDGGPARMASDGGINWVAAWQTTDDLNGGAMSDNEIMTAAIGTANNLPPNGTISQPSGPVVIAVGGSVNFAGAGNDSDGNTPLTYSWDFAGGATSSTSASPGSVTFNSPGIYVVNFTVTDSLGLADPSPATTQVTVNAPPNGIIDTPAGNITLNAGQPYDFLGTGSDPDNSGTMTFLWNFGGGPANSTAEDPTGVVFSTAGIYTITFTVTDAHGMADPSPASIQVTVNAPPNGTIDSPSANVTITAGQAVSFAATGSDPENNTPLTFLWDFGGGTTNTTVEDPGSITFSTPGEFSVALNVSDSLGHSDPTPAIVQVTVNAPNSLPEISSGPTASPNPITLGP